MTVFQLDECCSAKKHRTACNKEGLSKVNKFPSGHRSLKDPQMLEIYMKKTSVFVTTDSRLKDQHTDCIPNEHPGILIVAQSNTNFGTLTVDRAFNIIAGFKKSFPDWYNVVWRNSIVKITDECIEAGRKVGDEIKIEFFRELRLVGWQDEFKLYLSTNADSGRGSL